MRNISSLTKLTLDLPPSCVAFSPNHPAIFVIGTYFLHLTDTSTSQSESDGPIHDKAENENGSGGEVNLASRNGSLILYSLKERKLYIGLDPSHHQVRMLIPSQLISTKLSTVTASDFAILDLQWTPHSESLGDLLAVATSNGALIVYRLLLIDDRLASLEQTFRTQLCDESLLALQLTWHPSRSDIIGVTLSSGSVFICQSQNKKAGEPFWSDDSTVSLIKPYQHSLEAWTLAFLPSSNDRTRGTTSAEAPIDVVSGGDDMLLQCSSLPSSLQHEGSLLWHDRRIHQAGITAILPLSLALVLTGSYDDHIRLLAVPPRAGLRPQVLAEENLGGGVWRLKLLSRADDDKTGKNSHQTAHRSESTSFLILASCMHAGARVVVLEHCDPANKDHRNDNGGSSNDSGWSFRVVAKFEEHTSMNYGSDLQPSSSQSADERKKMTIVSTSLYDKLLCLWEFDAGGFCF